MELIEKIIYKIYSCIYDHNPALAFRIKYNMIFRVLNKLNHKRYIKFLIVTDEKDISDFLNLGIRNFRTNRGKNENNFIALRTFTNLLAIGPSIKYEEMTDNKLYQEADAIVLNKITEDSIKSSKPHIYILNNSWSIKNLDLLKRAYESNKNSLICTSFDNKYSFNYSKLIKEYTNQPFGISPMGLQRLLIILPSIVKHKSLQLIGYNLSLSTKPYSNTYPSLIINNWGSMKHGIFQSNKRHCFVYNYALTRQLVRDYKNELKSECLDNILISDFRYIMNEFINLYK